MIRIFRVSRSGSHQSMPPGLAWNKEQMYEWPAMSRELPAIDENSSAGGFSIVTL